MPSPDTTPEERQRLEVLWRAKLQQSRSVYNAATVQLQAVMQDYRAKGLPAPDGSLAVDRALKLETEARNKYIHTLRVFTDLLTTGKIPIEKD